MISVAEAKALVKANTDLLSAVLKPVPDAAGLVLAADIYARYDIPPFNQSSMDGYGEGYRGFVHWHRDSATIPGKHR